jgi:transposase
VAILTFMHYGWCNNVYTKKDKQCVIVKKYLSTRTHVCGCGCELHKDTNAAINILNLAKQAIGRHPGSNEARTSNLYSN